jgi:hypothetical protein
MKIYVTPISFCFITFHAFGQFFGGGGEGFHVSFSSIITLNDHSVYCNGNESDGFTFNSAEGYFYNATQVFSGGHGDGFIFGSVSETLNEQSLYCMGGHGDGTDLFFTHSLINDIQHYCAGGIGDGMNVSETINTLNQQNRYCSGGAADGGDLKATAGYVFGVSVFCFGADGDGIAVSNPSFLTVNNQQHYCSGEPGDGFSCFSFNGQISQPLIFSGGPGDGESRYHAYSQVLGYGIWTGNESSDWELAGNWKHNTVPSSGVNVFIPSDRQHYPNLAKSLSIGSEQGYFQCHRIDIDTVGFIDTKATFYVNGILNVYGTLTSASQDADATQVGPQGKITIRPGGNARFGVK